MGREGREGAEQEAGFVEEEVVEEKEVEQGVESVQVVEGKGVEERVEPILTEEEEAEVVANNEDFEKTD